MPNGCRPIRQRCWSAIQTGFAAAAGDLDASAGVIVGFMLAAAVLRSISLRTAAAAAGTGEDHFKRVWLTFAYRPDKRAALLV
jgi:hypothetical protein